MENKCGVDGVAKRQDWQRAAEAERLYQQLYQQRDRENRRHQQAAAEGSRQGFP